MFLKNIYPVALTVPHKTLSEAEENRGGLEQEDLSSARDPILVHPQQEEREPIIMPSGAKKRKAAKKKKEKETHNGKSSTDENPQGALFIHACPLFYCINPTLTHMALNCSCTFFSVSSGYFFNLG